MKTVKGQRGFALIFPLAAIVISAVCGGAVLTGASRTLEDDRVKDLLVASHKVEGTCLDKAEHLLRELNKLDDYKGQVKLVIGKYRSIDKYDHAWVEYKDFVLDPSFVNYNGAETVLIWTKKGHRYGIGNHYYVPSPNIIYGKNVTVIGKMGPVTETPVN